MTARATSDAPGALDLVEEATHLVRTAPPGAAGAYVLGVVPFVLAATFFVADMSRGAYAAVRLPGAALGLVAAFAWMKAWQAVAAEHALASLEQRAPARPGAAGWARLAARQFALHAFGLALLPLAVVLTLPLPWVYAYFQNVTVVGVGAGDRTRRVALEQARLWPGQNIGSLGAILVLAVLVLANVAVAIYTVPWLVRTLTGTERVFAQVGWNPLNTTFLAAVFAVGFLVIDPILKACYVLRCFYGRSRRTGVDLLVQVRSALGRAAGWLLAAGLVACAVPALPAAEPADAGPEVERSDVPAPGGSLPAKDLDASIDRVLQEPDYVWREPPPRSQGAASEFARWINRTSEAFSRWWRSLFDSDDDDAPAAGTRRGGSVAALVKWAFIAAAVVLVAAVVLTILRRSEAARRAPAPGATVAAVPALEREDVTADQLEEEEWMRLGRELIARGDVRLGMRALFLGSLAGLAARGLIALARHKSNRDYERELARRGAPLGAVVTAYVENRREFEGAWYGDRRPGAEALARFEENVRRLVRKEAA